MYKGMFHDVEIVVKSEHGSWSEWADKVQCKFEASIDDVFMASNSESMKGVDDVFFTVGVVHLPSGDIGKRGQACQGLFGTMPKGSKKKVATYIIKTHTYTLLIILA